MPAYVPDNGEQLLLALLKTAFGTSLMLRLYINDKVPAAGDLAAQYTEATFPNYAAKPVNGWGAITTNASGKAQMEDAARTFEYIGSAGVANTIYGYYVTDANGALLWAERNVNGPVTINAPGQSYTVLLRLTLSTEA